MADFDLTLQEKGGAAGVVLAFKTSASANEPLTITDRFLFPNSGREYVLIKKGAGAVDVTIPTPRIVDGLAVADRTVTVAGNSEVVLGPFDRAVYNDTDGKVAMEFDSITTLSVALLRL